VLPRPVRSMTTSLAVISLVSDALLELGSRGIQFRDSDAAVRMVSQSVVVAGASPRSMSDSA
ncbi:MAG: hypothetical protein ACJ0UT_03105, partial [Candidatus Latescibacterota bacterium]